jgi:hypothetical protein
MSEKTTIKNTETTLSWKMFWELLAGRGFVDSVGGSEYRRRTAELLSVPDFFITAEDEPVTEPDYPADKLYLTKSNALSELLSHLNEFSFLIGD